MVQFRRSAHKCQHHHSLENKDQGDDAYKSLEMDSVNVMDKALSANAKQHDRSDP